MPATLRRVSLCVRIVAGYHLARGNRSLDGTWDATALLLDKYEDVERVAARLPYVTGF
jgi:hypothetical protein